MKMGFIVYKKFYDMNYRGAKPRTYTDFMDSKHYASFVQFGRYMLEIQAINPEAFVDFLLKATVPMGNWSKPFVYEQYIRELNKRESADAAVERNILLMQQWEDDYGQPWHTFFENVSTNLAVQWIRSGRLSPWILYTATTSEKLFNRFTDEQIKLIEQYLNPVFWEMKFKSCPDDVKFIKTILAEAGV